MLKDVRKKAEEDIKYMFELLDSVDADDVKLDELTVRAGGKLLKFELVSNEALPIEDEIREELKQKMTSKLQSIKTHINSKITEMSSFVTEIRRSYEQKEKELDKKLKNAKIMPEVKYIHAQRGLSVVQGNGKDEYIWFVQAVYWPKFVNKQKIKRDYQKKLITPITIVIETNGSNVTRVSTRQPMGLEYFEHYHQSHPDCWGSWSYPREWRTPEDILQIAGQAQAVLETINTGSIANQTPRGLPRKATVMRHLEDEGPPKRKRGRPRKVDRVNINDEDVRSGVRPDFTPSDDVWMS